MSLNEATLEAKPSGNLPSSHYVQENQVLYCQDKLIFCSLTSALFLPYFFVGLHISPKPQQTWLTTTPICRACAEPWSLPSTFSRKHPEQKCWTLLDMETLCLSELC